MTNVPGASAVFLEGFVTYANEAKKRALGVDPALIAAHGAVSEPVARAMAEGARRAVPERITRWPRPASPDPDGGTEEKPVGTVFIALATKLGPTVVERHRFGSDRENFKDHTTQTALNLLRRIAPWRCLSQSADVTRIRSRRHGRADLHLLVDQRRDIRGQADAAVRRRIARQDADVQAHTAIGQPAKPLHRRARVVRAAGRGIDLAC